MEADIHQSALVMAIAVGSGLGAMFIVATKFNMYWKDKSLGHAKGLVDWVTFFHKICYVAASFPAAKFVGRHMGEDSPNTWVVMVIILGALLSIVAINRLLKL